MGTEKNKFLRVLGGAFGYGIKRDILLLYTILVRTYNPGDNESDPDKVFLFGFSRGAFTVRSLAGMINHIGILDNSKLDSEKEIVEAVRKAYSAYRKNKPLKGYDVYEKDRVGIEFVGVWDTVDAIGVPMDGLRKAIYAISSKLFTPHKDELNPLIKNAYHAMSIDDERRTFHPGIWKESGFDGLVEQVWFTGVHSNVGGGYPKDSLSYIPLDWMMKKANGCGLEFRESKWLKLDSLDSSAKGSFGDYQEQADRNGRIYNSRAGLAIFYRFSPRKIGKLWSQENPQSTPKIHESVLRRIESRNTNYAPTALPEKFVSVSTWSSDLWSSDQKSLDLDLSEAWSCIRKRIKLHFVLIASTISLIAAGVLMNYDEVDPCSGNELCTATLGILKNYLPDFMGNWLNGFAANLVVLGAFVLAFSCMAFLHNRWKSLTEHSADMAWREVVFDTESGLILDSTAEEETGNPVEEKLENIEEKIEQIEGKLKEVEALVEASCDVGTID